MADTGVNLDVELAEGEMAAIRRRLSSIADAQIEEVAEIIGETLLSSTLQRFRDQRGPDGKRWKPLKKPRPRGGSTILVDRAALRNSLHVAQDFIGIGSNEPHAATHQYGDFRRDKRGRRRNIPARPYLGITEDDREEIAATIADFLQQVGS